MRKIISIFLIIILAILIADCSKVLAAYVGIKVYLLGTNKSVDLKL